MVNQLFSSGLHFRSNPNFIISAVAIGLFTDLFLHGIVVPILPFLLQDRFHLPDSQIQPYTSQLSAIYAASTVIFSLPLGWLADRIRSRRLPYLVGLSLLVTATIMFAFGRSITVLMVARLLQGMSAAVVRSVGFAMVLESIGKGKIGQVLGMINSFSMIAQLIAPILGGLLYDGVGILAVFAVTLGVSTIDLIMRLLIIENRKSTSYYIDETSEDSASGMEELENEAYITESNALLPKNDETYQIPENIGCLVQAMPVLYCLYDPRFLMALLSSATQATIISMFDATIPTEADRLLNFSPLQVGVLFMALLTPCSVFSWFFGWVVDKYGTKIVAAVGYSFMVPCLLLLGLPSQEFVTERTKVSLFCAILSLNGVGLSIIYLPGFVEASNVMQRYEAANATLFAAHGSYAQLYGINSFFFFSGLAIGPLLGAALRDHVGYGGLGVGFAILSGGIAVLSFLFIGGKRNDESV